MTEVRLVRAGNHAVEVHVRRSRRARRLRLWAPPRRPLELVVPWRASAAAVEVFLQQSAGWIAARAAEAAARARADVLIGLIGLQRYADTPVSILSYGQKKLVALICAPLIAWLTSVLSAKRTSVRPVSAAIEGSAGAAAGVCVGTGWPSRI